MRRLRDVAVNKQGCKEALIGRPAVYRITTLFNPSVHNPTIRGKRLGLTKRPGLLRASVTFRLFFLFLFCHFRTVASGIEDYDPGRRSSPGDVP